MGLLYVLFRRLHEAAIAARRRASTSGYVAWSVAAGVAVGLAIACLLFVAASLWMVGLWLWAIGLVAVFVVPVSATLLARAIAVPLGWVRAAHALGRFSAGAGTDPEGYALVVAAWAALAARRDVNGGAIAWIEATREARGPLGDAEVIATALLLARSDERAARELLASVPELVENHPAAREIAGEYLAVSAIERGAWRELLPEAAPWPASPLRFFLEGIAARHLGHPSAPTRWGLGARWLLAPHRRATLAIWRAQREHGAGAAPQGAHASDDAAPKEPATSPTTPRTAPDLLRHAVHEHVVATARPAPSPREASAEAAATRNAELVALVTAWSDALTAPELRLWVDKRALELCAPVGAGTRALDELERAVVADLRAHIESNGLATPRLPPNRFGHALGAQLRHARLAEVELAFEHWSERVAKGTKLPPIAEWREFLAVRQAYRDLVASGGDDVRRLVFARAFEAANRAAVTLWNERDLFVLAHAILRWQRDEALAVGDSAAIELSEKNCRLKVQTRTGVA